MISLTAALVGILLAHQEQEAGAEAMVIFQPKVISTKVAALILTALFSVHAVALVQYVTYVPVGM